MIKQFFALALGAILVAAMPIIASAEPLITGADMLKSTEGLKAKHPACLPEQRFVVCVGNTESVQFSRMYPAGHDFELFIRINQLPADTTRESYAEPSTLYLTESGYLRLQRLEGK